ncbi:hypothetical protein, partial [Salmonella enterica]|uniref:hypothetical protein n=4 Tax=Salmonella enterica TaxID=28901 RepID=UPI001C3766B8
FNKSKGVLITGLKLKAFRNPQPSWGFSIDKKRPLLNWQGPGTSKHHIGRHDATVKIIWPDGEQ